MFESIMNMMKKITKKEDQTLKSKDAAKERLHLVLMQDRANVSADFLDLMKQEIIEVIKKYIDIDEAAMDVRLTNKDNGDGTNGAPALYANIPIINIKDETRQNAKVDTIRTENEIVEDTYVPEYSNEISDNIVNQGIEIEEKEDVQYEQQEPKTEEVKIEESTQKKSEDVKIEENTHQKTQYDNYNNYHSKKNRNKKNKKNRRR